MGVLAVSLESFIVSAKTGSFSGAARRLGLTPAALTKNVARLEAMPHAARWLLSGDLIRLLPGWYTDLGPICLYYPNEKLLPLRTRGFIDFVVDMFREQRFAVRFDGR